MSWVLNADFQATVWKVDPVKKNIIAAYDLTSLVSFDGLNVVTGGMANATATFADFDQGIRGKVQPHPMDLFSISANSRFSPDLTTIWTGVIDEVHNQFDPDNGDVLQLVLTGGAKYFEIVNQTPEQVGSLATAYLLGVSASSVLRYAAVQVGYPGPLGKLPQPAGLQIMTDAAGKPLVDVTAPLDVSTGAWVQPQQQTWMAVLQSLVAQTGTELYTDENGSLIFRPVQYLNQPLNPRLLQEGDIIGADLAESDTNVYTQVRVKWANDTAYSQDGIYPDYTKPDQARAYASLVDHLKPRILTVNQPWIRNAPLAQYLAQVLFQMAAANILVGTVTMPCDPAVRIGHIVGVPVTQKGDQIVYGYYYVNAITYNLQWNKSWTQTLSLAYGRQPDKSFPYLPGQNYPRITKEVLVGQPSSDATGGLDFTVTNPREYANAFTVVPDGSQKAGTISADPELLATGMVVIVKSPEGVVFGPTPNGDYTVTAGQLGKTAPPTIGMSGIPAPRQGRVFVVQSAPAAPPASGTSADPTTLQSYQSVTGDGSDLPTPAAFDFFPLNVPYTITQKFGPTSYTAEPPYDGYAHFHTGIDIGPNSGQSGAIIISPAAGVVRWVGYNLGANQSVDGVDFFGFGYNTVCRAGDLLFHFGHQVDGSALVQAGDSIAAGTQIGQVGSTGNSSGPHLHFGVYDLSAGTWMNPVDYFRAGNVTVKGAV